MKRKNLSCNYNPYLFCLVTIDDSPKQSNLSPKKQPIIDEEEFVESKIEDS
jgi:hypothetical protein